MKEREAARGDKRGEPGAAMPPGRPTLKNEGENRRTPKRGPSNNSEKGKRDHQEKKALFGHGKKGEPGGVLPRALGGGEKGKKA